MHCNSNSENFCNNLFSLGWNKKLNELLIFDCNFLLFLAFPINFVATKLFFLPIIIGLTHKEEKVCVCSKGKQKVSNKQAS